eukprot:TRINITY_DN8157_c0_g1_i1.p1 TRINITY_DN8157_c0_g1~~TRINITY_DN8157_c0_g1_i1.p1  ORF type:complete len:108 (-),score=9.69 TRINITY_DN8157_c0_g1_i1:76-399(-)
MDSLLTKKTISVTRKFNYTYYTSSSKDGKPTLLLLHGFPDTSTIWRDLVANHLLPAGYGVVAPDCLGYGDSSKPKEVSDYKWRPLIQDLVEILDAERLDTRVPYPNE